MTIIYDSKDHKGVIFSLHGTVWLHVLPLCIANMSITIAIYLLKDYDIVDLTFEDKGHQILATMVAYLVVSRVSSAYSRFWEARTLLSKALQQCRQLSIHTAAFTRDDKSEKAHSWRRLISKRLVEMLRATINVLEDADKTVELVHGPEDGRSKYTEYIDDPTDLAMNLHVAITLHKEYLEEALVIHKELKLHHYVGEFAKYYDDLAKFSATPYPFPTAQMTRIFLFVWMFTLPCALVNESSEPYSIGIIIFFITYGFFGLEFVSIELDDPFGEDPNDLEMRALSTVVIRGIREDLELLAGAKSASTDQDSYDA